MNIRWPLFFIISRLFSYCPYLYSKFCLCSACSAYPYIFKGGTFISSHSDQIFQVEKAFSKLNLRYLINNFNLKFRMIEIADEFDKVIVIIFGFGVWTYFHIEYFLGSFFVLGILLLLSGLVFCFSILWLFYLTIIFFLNLFIFSWILYNLYFTSQFIYLAWAAS